MRAAPKPRALTSARLADLGGSFPPRCNETSVHDSVPSVAAALSASELDDHHSSFGRVACHPSALLLGINKRQAGNAALHPRTAIARGSTSQQSPRSFPMGSACVRHVGFFPSQLDSIAGPLPFLLQLDGFSDGSLLC